MEAKANIAAENELFAPQKEKYESAMEQGKALIDSVVDVETANAALPKFQALASSLIHLACFAIFSVFSAKRSNASFPMSISSSVDL